MIRLSKLLDIRTVCVSETNNSVSETDSEYVSSSENSSDMTHP